MKKMICLLMVLLLLCGCANLSSMPFNGPIQFHRVSAVVPEKFIRDSIQSTQNIWLFEYHSYAECIIFSRKDIQGDTAASLDDYADYMTEQSASAVRTTFLDCDAVHSTYTKSDQFCQEMLFAYDGSFYAIALRGGSEEDFKSLLDTVEISEN